jgi:predicted esterase
MKRILKVGILMVPFILIGCGDGLHNPSNESVKGGELVVDFSAAVMKKTLVDKGVVSAEQTVYGYKAYKVPYTTTDEEGNEVKASGLFVIPPVLHDAVLPLGGLSMVSDDHGTIFANREAPSIIGKNNAAPDGSAVLLTSLGGFATLQPDYIGFGDSNSHYHPFVLKDSLANATVDFIKQVKIFSADNNITLNNQLFLTGYSEGGYAAMATLKKIEDEDLTDLTVSMAAPMAGPYALKGLADAVLSQPTLSVPSFMANVGYAYAKANNEDITTVINTPYVTKLPTLFNGDLNRTQIDPTLTKVTTGADGLFLQSFITDYFTNTNNWFAVAATENSLHAWTPTTPIKLVHCEGDDVIPYTISQATNTAMNQLGATSVSLVPVEATLGLPTLVGHSGCGTLAYKVTTGIFAQVRKATKNY